MSELNLKSQFIPIARQGLSRFTSNMLDTAVNAPFIDTVVPNARPLTKHSTENLEFPMNVASQIQASVIMVTTLCFISILKRERSCVPVVSQVKVVL